MNKKTHIPRRAGNLLLRFMDSEEQENFKEYMDSSYRKLLLTKGRLAARSWFWSQFTRSLPRLVKKSMEGGIIIMKNYLKIAFRCIKRRKIYSFINITG